MANNGADVAKNGDAIIQKITELENHFSYVGSPAEKNPGNLQKSSKPSKILHHEKYPKIPCRGTEALMQQAKDFCVGGGGRGGGCEKEGCRLVVAVVVEIMLE